MNIHIYTTLHIYIHIKFVCVHVHIRIGGGDCNGAPAGASPPVIILIFECRTTTVSFPPLPPFLPPSVHRGPLYGTDARPYTIVVAFCVGSCHLRRTSGSAVWWEGRGRQDVTRGYRRETAKINTPEGDGSVRKVMFTSCQIRKLLAFTDFLERACVRRRDTRTKYYARYILLRFSHSFKKLRRILIKSLLLSLNM